LEVADRVELLFLPQVQLVVIVVFLMVLLLLHQMAVEVVADIILPIHLALAEVVVGEELDMAQPVAEQQH
jgi:hypothetical protein